MVFPAFFNLSLNLADLERKIKKNKCKKKNKRKINVKKQRKINVKRQNGPLRRPYK